MSFQLGDVVVHKSGGGQPLTVVRLNAASATGAVQEITVSYATQGTEGIRFERESFAAYELETPLESMDREAALFKAMNERRKSLETPSGPQLVN